VSILYATPDAALDVDDSLLTSLGIHRISIPVPFVEAGGPVNACAIEEAGGGYTLFDCGISTEEGRAALLKGLDEHRLKLDDLKRIIVSHGHIDHYGNAQFLAEKTGARVQVHRHDEEKISGDGRWNKQLERTFDYYVSLGVPKDTLTAMLEMASRNRPYIQQVDRDRIDHLADGQRFGFKHLELELMHLPGHTPGLVCLWSAKHKLFFADDHVLARVSPNPLLDLTLGSGATKFRALSSYLVSAKKVRDMEIDVVVPGHGPCFKNHQPLLDGLFGFYAKRQDKLLASIQGKPQTPFELMHVLFPRVDVSRIYLMLSEVLGNLEVMEDHGRIRREPSELIRFAAA
jgi:glyoxylase-like metal-dependent hydrolase (beta-lactamase superfamily II)